MTRWPTTVAQARRVQERLRHRVVKRRQWRKLEYVAGVDVGFEDDGRTARAAVVVLEYPSLALRAQAIARRKVRFPYVPGYLSFREIPVVLAALKKLPLRPDVLLCDGQGYAHPRRIGFASHLGILAGLPSIGVAKSRLCGEHDDPPLARGAWAPLRDAGETIGAVLRTRTGVKPLYVSIGHRVDLRTAIKIVLACAPRYRLPETTRAAHRLASG
jgi:deoxyribonuclease V